MWGEWISELNPKISLVIVLRSRCQVFWLVSNAEVVTDGSVRDKMIIRRPESSGTKQIVVWASQVRPSSEGARHNYWLDIFSGHYGLSCWCNSGFRDGRYDVWTYRLLTRESLWVLNRAVWFGSTGLLFTLEEQYCWVIGTDCGSWAQAYLHTDCICLFRGLFTIQLGSSSSEAYT